MEKVTFNIKKLREEANMTQSVLAERAHVSRSLINQLETGRRDSANSKTLNRLAEALNCKVSDFFIESEV